MIANIMLPIALRRVIGLLVSMGVFSILLSGPLAAQIVYTAQNTDDSAPGSIRSYSPNIGVNWFVNGLTTEIRLHQLQEDAFPEQAVIELETPLEMIAPTILSADPDLPRPIIRPASGGTRLIEFAGNYTGEVKFSHIEFRDGDQNVEPYQGGAIFYAQPTNTDAVHLVIEGCHFVGNSAGLASSDTDLNAAGGAIFFSGRSTASVTASLVVRDSLFFDNQVKSVGTTNRRSQGPAMHVERVLMEVSGSIFELNSGNASQPGQSGGVLTLILLLPDSFIRDSFFTGNFNGTRESTILITSGSLIIDRCLFANNGNTSSGSVIGGGSGSPGLVVENTIIWDNQASRFAVWLGTSGTRATFRHCTIVGNQNNTGAADDTALRVIGTSTLTIERSIIAGNKSITTGLANRDISSGVDDLIVSNGYNFIGHMGARVLDSMTSTDIHPPGVGTILPLPVGSPGMYGGADFLIPPLPGSVLANAIPLDIDAGPYEPEFDIRGVSRRTNGRGADIGAIQLERISYEDWALASGLPDSEEGAATSDFSGDGVPNGLAYLLGLDPTEFHPNPLARTPGEEGTTLSFPRSASAYSDPTADWGVSSWALETSVDLEDWTPLVEPEVIQPDVDSLDEVVVAFEFDESDDDRRFYRFKVD